MKRPQATIITALCLISLSSAAAQTARRRPVSPQPAGRSTAAVPAPSPSPTPVVLNAPVTTFGSLATVNGQTITVTDLDPSVAEEMGNLGRKIMQARLQVLELQVNTQLLDLEAKKRKVTPQQLYDLEVTKRITEPTEAEIKQFIEANKDQLTDSNPQNVRAQVIAFLHGQREEKLSDEFVQRMRASIPVVAGVDINGANVSPSAVVATVGGQPIVASAITEKLKPIIYKLQLENYQLGLVALNRAVDDVLLIAEANKRNVPPEDIVRTEITEKLHHPSDAEVAKFYADNKASINGDLDSAKGQLAGYLQQQDQSRLEQALSERLRKGAQIQVLFTEPVRPAQTINIDGAASRGDANARATLVEFTDFECPACAAMQPVLEEVLKSYGNRVRFVVRNYPLTRHAHARKAAEAAEAARAQGKFFEYTALLFQRQKALDIPSLKQYATELGLDRARFDAELDGSKYAPLVRHDMDEGQTYGVEATPTIFVNGLMMKDLTAAALVAALDRALAAPAQTPK
jgi:protein-disulfide isomerase